MKHSDRNSGRQSAHSIKSIEKSIGSSFDFFSGSRTINGKMSLKNIVYHRLVVVLFSRRLSGEQ